MGRVEWITPTQCVMGTTLSFKPSTRVHHLKLACFRGSTGRHGGTKISGSGGGWKVGCVHHDLQSFPPPLPPTSRWSSDHLSQWPPQTSLHRQCPRMACPPPQLYFSAFIPTSTSPASSTRDTDQTPGARTPGGRSASTSVNTAVQSSVLADFRLHLDSGRLGARAHGRHDDGVRYQGGGGRAERVAAGRGIRGYVR